MHARSSRVRAVSYDLWQERRAANGRVSHILVAFFVVPISDEELARGPLRLQPGECDAACWAPLEDVAHRLCTEVAMGTQDTSAAAAQYACQTSAADGGELTVEASRLAGVYPNELGEGIGRGHLFALRQLVQGPSEGE